jgi:hypothetical protein
MVGLGLLLACGTALAQVPKDQLAKPPAGARHFVILSTGGKQGDSWMWTAPDGVLMGRESMVLRGQVWDMDSSGMAGKDGMPAAMTIRGVTPQGMPARASPLRAGRRSGKARSMPAPLPMRSPRSTRPSAARWR